MIRKTCVQMLTLAHILGKVLNFCELQFSPMTNDIEIVLI